MKPLKLILIQIVTLFISACASADGPWPDLASPLPNDSARERVIIRAEPSAIPKPLLSDDESHVMSPKTMRKVLMDTTNAFQFAQTTYQKHAIQGLESWNTAQLLLTRMSHISAPIYDLSISDDPLLAKQRADAIAIIEALEDFVVNERKALNKTRP